MRRTTLIVSGLALLLIALSLWLFQTAPSAVAEREMAARLAEAQESGPGEPPPSLTIDVVVAQPTSARSQVDVSCELDAIRHVVIGAEVSGRVVSIEAEEHAVAKEGDVLVRLDPELPGASVARARAALRSAEARRELAAAELARQQELSNQGVASAAELDRVQSEARTGDAGVAEAKASLLDAETRLAKTAIRAPFAGVVGSIDLQPGAYVRAGDPVTSLADLTEIEVEVGVSDQEVLSILPGDTVSLRVDALGTERFEGRVERPGRTPDASTRKYPVPIRVANPDGRLLPGMLGTVTFSLGDEQSVLRIPRRAVQREFDLEYLYVVEPDAAAGPEAGAGQTARVVRRRVQTQAVPFQPELVEIREGLRAGERVAVSSLRDLRDGKRVRTRAQRQLGSVQPALADEAAP